MSRWGDTYNVAARAQTLLSHLSSSNHTTVNQSILQQVYQMFMTQGRGGGGGGGGSGGGGGGGGGGLTPTPKPPPPPKSKAPALAITSGNKRPPGDPPAGASSNKRPTVDIVTPGPPPVPPSSCDRAWEASAQGVPGKSGKVGVRTGHGKS